MPSQRQSEDVTPTTVVAPSVPAGGEVVRDLEDELARAEEQSHHWRRQALIWRERALEARALGEAYKSNVDDLRVIVEVLKRQSPLPESPGANPADALRGVRGHARRSRRRRHPAGPSTISLHPPRDDRARACDRPRRRPRHRRLHRRRSGPRSGDRAGAAAAAAAPTVERPRRQRPRSTLPDPPFRRVARRPDPPARRTPRRAGRRPRPWSRSRPGWRVSSRGASASADRTGRRRGQRVGDGRPDAATPNARSRSSFVRCCATSICSSR